MNWDPAFLVLLGAIGVYLGSLAGFIVRMLVAFAFLFAINNWKPHDSAVYGYVIRPILEVLAIPFIICDVILNWYITLLMVDLPDHWDETVSQRLGRYMFDESPFTWRGRFAAFFCKILDYSDPGHCRKQGPRR